MIDCHYHLEGSMVSIPCLLKSMDAHGVRRTALIATLTAELRLPRFSGPALAVFRRLLLARVRFAHDLGLSFYRRTVKRDGAVDLLGASYEIKSQPRNDEILEAVKALPDRFWGWIFVNPVGPVDPQDEIERCRQQPGMIGVKAHPFWHDYPIERLTDVAARCQELALPMLIHLGADAHGDYRLLPELFPRLTVIYAHAGVPYAREVCAYARGRDRVFVDLSSPAYVDSRVAREAVRLAGSERCLFGSDGPYFHVVDGGFDYRPVKHILFRLGLSDRERERIEEKNFLELLGRA